LIVNGASVAQRLQDLAGIQLEQQPMNEWSLMRRHPPHVLGLAYQGAVRTVAGVTLRREILVLGFNHNIQSSFGVTTDVRRAIRHWIASAAARVVL
jgi:hypothetical protein